jgi:hypothetical protein
MYDMHSGQQVSTENWPKYLLNDPGVFYYRDADNDLFDDGDGVEGPYTPPPGTQTESLWLRYDWVVMTFREPDGTRVRAFAPINALERLPQDVAPR